MGRDALKRVQSGPQVDFGRIFSGRFLSLGSWAQVAERLMAADCKSAAPWSYGGSNPPLCTTSLMVLSCALEGAGRMRSEAEQERIDREG